jgi:hypothetical protein
VLIIIKGSSSCAKGSGLLISTGSDRGSVYGDYHKRLDSKLGY